MWLRVRAANRASAPCASLSRSSCFRLSPPMTRMPHRSGGSCPPVRVPAFLSASSTTSFAASALSGGLPPRRSFRGTFTSTPTEYPRSCMSRSNVLLVPSARFKLTTLPAPDHTWCADSRSNVWTYWFGSRSEFWSSDQIASFLHRSASTSNVRTSTMASASTRPMRASRLCRLAATRRIASTKRCGLVGGCLESSPLVRWAKSFV